MFRTLKHNQSKSLRRLRAIYYADGTRSDGAKVYRVTAFKSRSKHVPHEGAQQKAKREAK